MCVFNAADHCAERAGQYQRHLPLQPPSPRMPPPAASSAASAAAAAAAGSSAPPRHPRSAPAASIRGTGACRISQAKAGNCMMPGTCAAAHAGLLGLVESKAPSPGGHWKAAHQMPAGCQAGPSGLPRCTHKAPHRRPSMQPSIRPPTRQPARRPCLLG